MRALLCVLASVVMLGLGPRPAAAAALAGEADFLEASQYETATGVPLDYQRAYDGYCRAARQGHAGAAMRLAGLYMNGAGVPADKMMATAWARKAVGLGNPAAKVLLARLPQGTAPEARCEPLGEGALPAQAGAGIPPAAIDRLVRRLAPGYGLSPDLVLAIIRVESGFQPNAISPRNGQGLMQLIPDTASRFGVSNPFDPQQNLIGGMKYLRWLMAYFKGNVPLVLAAYNAGEGAVNEHDGIPPYEETRNYVARIQGIYPAVFHPFDPTAANGSSSAKPSAGLGVTKVLASGPFRVVLMPCRTRGVGRTPRIISGGALANARKAGVGSARVLEIVNLCGSNRAG